MNFFVTENTFCCSDCTNVFFYNDTKTDVTVAMQMNVLEII